MKKLVLFVLAAVCLGGVFLLAKDALMSDLEVFKNAFSEVEQWKTLM